jgi:long-subunit acyl-CoA synthetase (AMP-forming)
MACWLSNRPEFHVADLAAAHLGVASFFVYPTYTVEQAEHALADAGARILITESAFLESACAVRQRGHTVLENIVVVDDGGSARTTDWQELLDLAPRNFDFDARMAAVQPGDVLTLIYTSGTTGAPKGVQLTHRNAVAQLAALSDRLRLADGISAVSWLPMAHVAERLCTHYLPITRGWRVTTCADAKLIVALLPDVRPQFFFSPPRLWEKLQAAVLARTGGEIPSASAAQASLEQLGLDQVRVAIVGAAPCSAEVIDF